MVGKVKRMSEFVEHNKDAVVEFLNHNPDKIIPSTFYLRDKLTIPALKTEYFYIKL